VPITQVRRHQATPPSIVTPAQAADALRAAVAAMLDRSKDGEVA